MNTVQALIPEKPDFYSPTFGLLSFKEMFLRLAEYMEEEPEKHYNLIVGTDSVQINKTTLLVNAIVVHKVGHGGRYFYKKIRKRRITSLRQRIFYETLISLEVASMLETELSRNGFSRIPLEIHLDIGQNGDTRDIIKEVVGMVTGSGYFAVTKPDAYGASKVADRHSK